MAFDDISAVDGGSTDLWCVIHQLGSGGYSSVWIGLNKHLDCRVFIQSKWSLDYGWYEIRLMTAKPAGRDVPERQVTFTGLCWGSPSVWREGTVTLGTCHTIPPPSVLRLIWCSVRVQEWTPVAHFFICFSGIARASSLSPTGSSSLK